MINSLFTRSWFNFLTLTTVWLNAHHTAKRQIFRFGVAHCSLWGGHSDVKNPFTSCITIKHCLQLVFMYWRGRWVCWKLTVAWRRPESETLLVVHAKHLKLHDSLTPCLKWYLKCFSFAALVGRCDCLSTGGFCGRLSVLFEFVGHHYLAISAGVFSPGVVSFSGSSPTAHRSFNILFSSFTPISWALNQTQSFCCP